MSNSFYAFPKTPHAFGDDPLHQWKGEQDGMTMRDWFASCALSNLDWSGYTGCDSLESIAQDVYALADAMLAERSKNENA